MIAWLRACLSQLEACVKLRMLDVRARVLIVLLIVAWFLNHMSDH